MLLSTLPSTFLSTFFNFVINHVFNVVLNFAFNLVFNFRVQSSFLSSTLSFFWISLYILATARFTVTISQSVGVNWKTCNSSLIRPSIRPYPSIPISVRPLVRDIEPDWFTPENTGRTMKTISRMSARSFRTCYLAVHICSVSEKRRWRQDKWPCASGRAIQTRARTILPIMCAPADGVTCDTNSVPAVCSSCVCPPVVTRTHLMIDDSQRLALSLCLLETGLKKKNGKQTKPRD